MDTESSLLAAGQAGTYDRSLSLRTDTFTSLADAPFVALGQKGGGGHLTINQIADQLANSKASPKKSDDSVAMTTVVCTSEQSKNPIVSKMTEALSLKQSPTLTKQLAAAVGGANSVQVITQYMCRYCGRQFESTVEMQHHIQEHVEGKAPHECSVCGKVYRTPSKLQRHVRVHSGERPYACSVCGRRFTRSDHVKQHMKVHFQPKDVNVCHLCSDMKFNRRAALHLHLQQQHGIQQVFTCHRCGEAYQSLEEMQTHKLTHDTFLNSLKSNTIQATSGVAKFALGPQKLDQGGMKSEAAASEDVKHGGMLKITTNGIYVPANLDNVTSLSNKLLMEGMEKMAKEAEVQKKYQEELNQLNHDAKNYQKLKQDMQERAKIAEIFNIKQEVSNGGSDEIGDYSPMEDGLDDGSLLEVRGKETTTLVNADGMSMFIVPTLQQIKTETESEMEADDLDESEQNSSKDSVGINREGDIDKSEGDVHDNGETDSLGRSISPKSAIKMEGYSKPCPKSKKPGFVPPTLQSTETKTVSSGEYEQSPKPMLSLLTPKISELIKAKVEQNLSQSGQTFIISNQIPKLTFIPNVSASRSITATTLQHLLPAINSTISIAPAPIAALHAVPRKGSLEKPRLLRCEHCCIWFEDMAMSMLHSTLHSADGTDPFTCRKCYKKLGNRLEFMAHMVWHLEPNMDI